YQRFFSWLMETDLVSVTEIKEIPIETLEHLSKKDLEAFVLYLRERPLLNANSTKTGLSQTTINRTLSALSSLFKFLTEEVENEQGEP
ncbi:site-specific integrase, partial [Streptococcus danieliae]|nr:site-specific integrase [Streptococcus danieliae]